MCVCVRRVVELQVNFQEARGIWGLVCGLGQEGNIPSHNRSSQSAWSQLFLSLASTYPNPCGNFEASSNQRADY